MSLESLLRKHEVDEPTIKRIVASAKKYIREGARIADANAAAIDDHLEELRERVEEIEHLSGAAEEDEDEEEDDE